MVSVRSGLCAPLFAALLATAFNAVTTGSVQAWSAEPIRPVVPAKTPTAMGGEAFQRFVSNEINRWRKVAQETGIKPE